MTEFRYSQGASGILLYQKNGYALLPVNFPNARIEVLSHGWRESGRNLIEENAVVGERG